MFRKIRGDLRNRSGQSTVEYILLVTAVIGVMIFFLTKPNTGLQSKLSNTLNASSESMSNMANRLQHSQDGSGLGKDSSAITVDAVGPFK